MSQGAATSNLQNNLRPVTLRQIRDATRAHSEAPFEIEGKEVRMISTVAQLLRESVAVAGRKVRYELNDGTCHLDAWRTLSLPNDPDDRTLHGRIIVNNESCYVRVIGYPSQLRIGAQTSINAVGIQKVQNGNEVLHHYMDAMVATLSAAHGQPSNDRMKNAQAKAAEEVRHAESRSDSPTPQGSGARRPSAPPSTPKNPRQGSRNGPFSPGGAEERRPSPSPSAHFRPSPAPTPSTPKRPAREETPGPSPAPSQARSSSTPDRGREETPNKGKAKAAPNEGSNTRAQEKQPKPGPSVFAESSKAHSRPSTFTATGPPTPPETPSRSNTPRSRASGLANDPLSHLTGLQRQIMLQIMNSKSGRSRKGLHVNSIVLDMEVTSVSGLTPEAIIEGLTELVNKKLIEPADPDCLITGLSKRTLLITTSP